MKNALARIATSLALTTVIVLAGLPASSEPNASEADRQYYDVSFADLVLQDGATLPSRNLVARGIGNAAREGMHTHPRVVLRGKGEAYAVAPTNSPAIVDRNPWSSWRLTAALPAGESLSGILFLPNDHYAAERPFLFDVPGATPAPDHRKAFRKGLAQAMDRNLQLGFTGAPWYRLRLREATVDERPNQNWGRVPWRLRNQPTLQSSMDLFSGGRAVSENMPFNLALSELGTENWTEPLSDVAPVELREVDFSTLMTDAPVVPDPLAGTIPADQHALFFPSLERFETLLSRAQGQGMTYIRMFDRDSYDAHLQARYERQLLISLAELRDTAGDLGAGQVALTGGGVDLALGTDIALVIETNNAEDWRALLEARQREVTDDNPDTRFRTGTYEGHTFTLAANDHRSVSCVVAALPGCVVLSNSANQLQRIIDTADGKTEALDTTVDYQFFRQRYPAGDPKETMFLIATDQTFRRWTGPRHRIAASRRLRARTVLSNYQMEHLYHPGTHAGNELTLRSKTTTDTPIGRIEWTDEGPFLPVYGTLPFMTPVSEMEVDRVSREEARAYQAFASRYVRGFLGICDPIGVQMKDAEGQTTLAITVHPLRVRSDYTRYAEWAQGATLPITAGTPDADSVFEGVLAISQESPSLVSLRNATSQMAPSFAPDLLQWLGGWVGVRLETGQDWEAFKEQALNHDYSNGEPVPRYNPFVLPAVFMFDCQNPVGLSAFIVALKQLIEGYAPNMLTFEAREHAAQQYVRVGLPSLMTKLMANSATGVPLTEFFYYTSLDRFLLTTREDLMQKAIARHVALQDEAGVVDPNKVGDAHEVWKDESVGVRITPEGLTALEVLSREYNYTRLRAAAWRNLDILNVWRSTFGAEDALAFHEKHWFAQLACPGGGAYVWNETDQTYESTVFGHPGRPKPYKPLDLPWKHFAYAEGSFTFEGDGIRTALVIHH